MATILKCSCSSRDLLNHGCRCGYFQQCKRDAELLKQSELDAAKKRIQAVAEWLSPMPAGVMIAPDECATCGHSSFCHASGWGNMCNEKNCSCMKWVRKPDVILG